MGCIGHLDSVCILLHLSRPLRHPFIVGCGRMPPGMETLLLPPAWSPGAFIGVRAENVKYLQQKTSARISLDINTRVITVSGTSQAVALACHMIHAQFDAQTTTGAAYPHPLCVMTVLGQQFGGSDSTVRFMTRDDEVSEAVEERSKAPGRLLLCLSPVGMQAMPGLDGYTNGHMGAKQQGLQAGEEHTLFAYPQLSGVLGKAASTMAAAMGDSDRLMDELKMELCFGKAFFYKGVGHGTQMKLLDLQHQMSTKSYGSFGDGIRSVFSNAVSQADTLSLRSFLSAKGFKPVSSLHKFTCHVMNRDLHTGYSLSFAKDDTQGRRLRLRKITTRDAKVFFLNLVGDVQDPDMRIKALAQYNMRQGSEALRQLEELAGHCRLDSNDQLVVDVPRSLSVFQIGKVRSKLEEVLEAEYVPGCSLNVVISSITAPGDQAHHPASCHTEVAVFCNQLTETLAQALAQRRSPHSLADTIQQPIKWQLTNMARFYEEACAALAGARS